MSFFKAKQLGFLVGLTVLSLGVAQGCSSGDDSQAAPNGGSGGKGNAGSAGKAGSGNSNGGNDTPGAGGEAGSTPINNGGEAGTAGAPPAGGDEAGAAGAPAMTQCDGPNGCYSCAPTTDIQFANYCVTGGCPAHFDNSTLSKIAKVGTL